ncbi:MAG: ABC transporter ATP-binding protein [Armatimonadota bacterium]|nr:ABC transporter ATP-binding protein [Armatimonadota bacterium]MDR7402164.1 ABC transporter ATP-binding protein [Armatimonadota bacterium]MDR7404667.1 ABC transporter ATP-binding protein [Armatimonadota bacterium]MDR7436921.1 ABC transporter ATP-binding protein [Armatimonadota bacterium]MDR7472305.1 ABC transporter ATP-binding protein [Armatimonadota bacterium]
MIEVCDLRVRFGPREVLRGVDLVVPAGQRVAVVGPNGAGKTTLLRALLGLVPAEGTARIGGRDVRSDGPAARALVGYVPQIPAFPATLTIAEVVQMCAELRGVDVDPRAVLETADLAAHASRPVRALSGGMVRRLALACSRIADPPVWLLDEPAAHLDRDGEARLHGWLDEAARRGATVLVATHHLDGLDARVDRVVALEGGRVAADLTVDELARLRWVEVVLPAPVPAVGSEVVVLADTGGQVRLRVRETDLPRVMAAVDGRPFRLRSPGLRELLVEARR